MFCMLYVFFWVIPRHLNFICRRFGTLCVLHLHRLVGVHLPAYEDGTDSVPKRRHIKLRLRGITQKKTYNKLGFLYTRYYVFNFAYQHHWYFYHSTFTFQHTLSSNSCPFARLRALNSAINCDSCS